MRPSVRYTYIVPKALVSEFRSLLQRATTSTQKMLGMYDARLVVADLANKASGRWKSIADDVQSVGELENSLSAQDIDLFIASLSKDQIVESWVELGKRGKICCETLFAR